MRVAVVGTGHVGLVTSVALAKLGHQVAGMDADGEKISLLQQGGSPFFEPGLDDLLSELTASGSLMFSSQAGEVVPGAEVVFICVGTPARVNGEANLIAVERAGREVARHASDGVVVAEKSTVPAGTARRVRLTMAQERPGLSFEVVSNPEFLREGRGIEDSLHPDRILIGAESPHGFEVMRRLYEPLTRNGCRLIEASIPTAELAKHACNAFLALKISYVNAVARICERAGADIVAVADVMGADPRIGRAFLNAGLGYGGYCFPKDLVAFERLAAQLGCEVPLLKEVARINDEAVEATVGKIREAVWNLEDKKVTLLGLAFKAETDDVRFSPALQLARRLIEEGAQVVGYDPRAAANAKEEVPGLELASDPYEAAWGSHCLVVCTDWEDFRTLDLSAIREVMFQPAVVDGRNIFDPAAMQAAGFVYYPTGRPPVHQVGA